jgi:DNA-binding protein Fis
MNDGSDETLRSLEEVKRLHVEDVLRACRGNQTEAARRLGINRKTVARFVPRDEPSDR